MATSTIIQLFSQLPTHIRSKFRHHKSRQFILGVTLGLAGVVISLLLGWWLWRQELALAKAHFNRDAGWRVEALRKAISERLHIVELLATFYAGSEIVERHEFHAFAEPLEKRHPGIQALGWAPHITAENRQAHEEAVRKEGFQDYHIWERSGKNETVAAAPRREYWPILYLEPANWKPDLIGFDLSSQRSCYAAIEQALTSSQVAAGICSPAEMGESTGPLLFLVAHTRNIPFKTSRSAAQPEPDGLGFGIFPIVEIVESSLDNFTPVGIDLYLFDSSAGGKRRPLYARLSPLRQEKKEEEHLFPRGEVYFTDVLDFNGIYWQVECHPMQAYLSQYRSWRPLAVSVVGLLITALLVWNVVLFVGRAAYVRRLVHERTEALYESENRFRRLIENAGDAFFLHDIQGRILNVNRQACESLGYSREELLSMTIADVDVEVVPKRHTAQYWRRAQEEYPITFEGTHRRKDGSTFPVEVRLAPVVMGGERLILGLARNITERKQAEQRLREEQRLLRELLELHERDRKLLAYEIHDGLTQQLTAALYQLQAAENKLEGAPEGVRHAITDATETLRKAAGECRRLISGLRPPLLDEAGIIAAIEYLVAEHRRREDIDIDFIHHVNLPRLAPPLENTVFRIVQEILTNICRHSRSNRARIELRQENSMLFLEAQDWGVGFDPAQVPQECFGLRGIRERARLFGGRAVIDSAPGKGTIIRVELPLPAPSSDSPVEKPLEKNEPS